jgi:hypothetical protein
MITQEYLDFSHDHLNCDIHNLVLSSSTNNSFDIKYAARLISSKQKLIKKMPLWAYDKKLYFPSPLSVEQSSSQLTGKNKQNLIQKGIVFDITGGIGVDTYFYAQVNERVHYFEKNRELFESTRHNLAKLNIDNVSFHNTTATPHAIRELISNSLSENNNCDTLLYIDPSRRSTKGEKMKSVFDYEPDFKEFADYMRGLPIKIVVKLSPITDITEISRSVRSVDKFEIVSLSNECKELLLTINPELPDNYPTDSFIEAKMLDSKGVQTSFIFRRDEKKRDKPTYSSDIHQYKYLYEPDNAILSVGAFNTVALRCKLVKIAPNTHLYLSNSINDSFPGKIFKIKKVEDYNKRTIRNLHIVYPKANISVRNFQLNAVALKKQLKTDDGGNISIFGCSLNSGERKIIISSRIK